MQLEELNRQYLFLFTGVELIYNVVLLSAIQHSESVIYMCVCVCVCVCVCKKHSFFKLFSHIGHYRVLSRVPYALQYVLISNLFYM